MTAPTPSGLLSSSTLDSHTLGEILATARQNAGLSQVQAAQRSGVSRITISDVERGAEVNVGLRTLTRLLSVYGLKLQVATKSRRPTFNDIQADNQARQESTRGSDHSDERMG